MKATKRQVERILRDDNTISKMTRGKTLVSYLYNLSRFEASEIIERLEDGEEVEVGK